MEGVIEATGRLLSPRTVAAALPGLTRALNDRDPEVRRAAAEALGKTQEN